MGFSTRERSSGTLTAVIGNTIGNYVVTEKIGQGGMGVVYLAEHPQIGRQVAIKVLLPELSKDPRNVNRFFNEARAANEIRNEHIVDTLDFGELADKSHYIIMEWLEGRSLTQAIKSDGRFSIGRAVHVARGIGDALAAAHHNGIVHRDLKPDNIFLIRRSGDPDFVKVLDFGIAKLMQHTAAEDVKTQTGALLGTPLYMSPEQCRGIEIDQRTDIYALGVILYQLTCGRVPFYAEGLGALLLLHMTQPPDPPRQHNPEIPEGLEQAILRALEKDVNTRYPSIEALLTDIIPFEFGAGAPTGGMTVPLMMPSVSDTVGRAVGEAQPTTVQRRRSLALPLGITAAAVAIGGAILLPRLSPHPVVHAPIEKPAIVTAPPVAKVAAVVSTPPQKNPPAGPVTAEEKSAVNIHIIVLPDGARLSLDGTPVPNPFFRTVTRSTEPHLLTAKAHGYQTLERSLVFDRDYTPSAFHLLREPPPPLSSQEPKTTTPKLDNKPLRDSSGRIIYKGTKGTLNTNFPDEPKK